MTQDEGIALLKRIYKELPTRRDSFTLSLVCEKNTTSIPGQTWLISINGWTIESEEEWGEYITADDPREFIVDTETKGKENRTCCHVLVDIT